jgi:hypothetical protein
MAPRFLTILTVAGHPADALHDPVPFAGRARVPVDKNVGPFV